MLFCSRRAQIETEKKEKQFWKFDRKTTLVELL